MARNRVKTLSNANNVWQLYAAKNQLSRIIEQSAQAPQTITVRGKEAAVVISCADYKKLKKPKQNIVDCLGGCLDDDDARLFTRDKILTKI